MPEINVNIWDDFDDMNPSRKGVIEIVLHFLFKKKYPS